eukprot:GDKK01026295.1.p3 GENE.GDKK01026295.1~~GDKK01026295.1.p3  ORF type:complete len:117 (+),score=0.05 GDKK01026295.1:260-610(+)
MCVCVFCTTFLSSFPALALPPNVLHVCVCVWCVRMYVCLFDCSLVCWCVRVCVVKNPVRVCVCVWVRVGGGGGCWCVCVFGFLEFNHSLRCVVLFLLHTVCVVCVCVLSHVCVCAL